MRACIYGAGAMGTSLGVRLPLPTEELDFVTRNHARVRFLNERGAIVDGRRKRVRACLPEEMRGGYDLVILATKQSENALTAEFLLPYLKADGALVTVQNGLPERTLAETVGADRVYGCTLSWGAAMEENAVSVTGAGYRMGLGAYGAGERLADLARLFSAAGTVSTGNLTELRYAKLAMNASFSTLSALSGLPFGTIARKYGRYALAIMRETFSVARAAGCEKLPLNGRDLFRVFARPFGFLLPIAMKPYAQTRSGMLADLRAGKRCDVDFVAGMVVREGLRLGAKTPVTARAVALVHEVENGLAETAPETIGLLKGELA